MIEQVLRELNDYFFRSSCNGTNIAADGVTVDDVSAFTVNQYILVNGSRINDGVYKIKAIVNADKKLMADGLQVESGEFNVYGLAIPKAVLDLATEIEAYIAKNPDGIAAETLGDYSVTYGGGRGSNDFSWKSVYRSRLAAFRQVFMKFPVNWCSYDSRY